MTIMGFDPGTARLGWGTINVHGHVITATQFGCITTDAGVAPEQRLATIYQDLTTLLHTYTPRAVAVEEIFFATNAKTIIPVAQARGIILLAAAQAHVPVVSYSPLAIKQTICGYGKADKVQVQKMVVRLLNLKKTPTLDDTADALAIALTHAYTATWKEKVQ